MAFYICLVSGFVSGLLGGMGMGGGTLLIPVLTIFFSVPQKIAQSTNLLAFLPMSASSLKIHYDNGLLKCRGTGYIIIPAVLLSVVGSLAAGRLPSDMLRKGFGIFLCVLSFFQLFSAINQFTKKKKKFKIKGYDNK